MIVTIVQVHSVRNAFHNFTQLLLAGVFWLWRQMMVKVEGGKDPRPGHLLRPWSYSATSRPRLGFKLKLSGAAALHLLTIITTGHLQFGCQYSQNHFNACLQNIGQRVLFNKDPLECFIEDILFETWEVKTLEALMSL